MLNLLIYLLEVSVITSIFFLFYRYLYFKIAYFEWSRSFFYVSLVLSLTIPLLPGIIEFSDITMKLDMIFGDSGSDQTGRIDYININDSYLHEQDSFLSKIPFVLIFFVIWISGLARYLFIILRSIISVTGLKLKSKTEKQEAFKIVHTDIGKGCFTFFRNIFVSKETFKLPEAERKQVLDHEKIHAKQLHTVDNIIFELYRAVFWFNPISKHIAANVKIIHEFIVDTKLTGNKNKPDYSRLILKLASHRSHVLMVSSFSNEEVKTRIKLISIPESQNIRKRRFIISIPVLFITMLAMWIIVSTVNVYAKDVPDTISEFVKPFDKGSYKIASPYFKNLSPAEIYKGKNNDFEKNSKTKISHLETGYELKSFSNIYAIENGFVSHIKREDIFGLEEISLTIDLSSGHKIIYKGLYQTSVKKNDKVKQGDIIGLTGDIRLYPTVTVKIEKDGETFDPEHIY